MMVEVKKRCGVQVVGHSKDSVYLSQKRKTDTQKGGEIKRKAEKRDRYVEGLKEKHRARVRGEEIETERGEKEKGP